jgi:hypothetical protein
MLLFGNVPVLKMKEPQVQQNPVVCEIESEKFSMKTVTYYKDNTVSVISDISWYDPISKDERQKHDAMLFILDGTYT